MDAIKAKSYESLFNGKQIDGWTVAKLIGFGKSAAVFRAEGDARTYAVKIFDTELDERFGHEIQLKRIKQEIGLRGHGIPNLIDIVGVGSYPIRMVRVPPNRARMRKDMRSNIWRLGTGQMTKLASQ